MKIYVLFFQLFVIEGFRLFKHANRITMAPVKALKKTASTSTIDGKSITDNAIIEYLTVKGSKRLAIVSKKSGAHLDVVNEARKTFSVPLSRVSYHINGSFAFGDLVRLNELIIELKPQMVSGIFKLATFLICKCRIHSTCPTLIYLHYIGRESVGGHIRDFI